MYASLYRNPTTAILDNRKFINPDAVVYEVPPKVNKYIPDETLEERINYSYGQNLKHSGAKDVYMYRHHSNIGPLRDEDTSLFKYEKNEVKENYVVNNNDSHSKDSNYSKDSKDSKDSSNDSCSADPDGVKNICGSSGGQLFPIMDPRFNLREAAKNMILLEDHLFQMGKRCQDCILKHCLTIEGFLEEGITLDIKGEHIKTLEKSSEEFRKIFKNIAKKVKENSLTNEDCFEIAQNIRKIRKPLCQGFATFI